MEFGNPIVGSEDLIREAIKSPNFNTDPESGNVTGWRIARDGSATFYNLTIGSTNFNIDENGNAVFQTVSANNIFLDGENLADKFVSLPRGMLAVTTSTISSNAYDGTNPVVIGRITIPNFDITRQYRLGWIMHIDKVNSTPLYYGLQGRLAFGSTADASTASFFSTQTATGSTEGDPNLGSGNDNIDIGTHTFNNLTEANNGLDASICLTLTAETAGPRMEGEGYNRIWVEDVGLAVGYGNYDPSNDEPPVQQYTKTYTAQWSESYQSDGSSRGSFDNGHCFQGYYSSTNGNQFSLVGLPESTIVADITGATIIKTEIYLDNQHFYSNGGGTAYVGTHEYASAPSNASLSNVRERLDSESFDYGQAKWFTVTNTIATDFLNNSAKGIAIGPGPSNSQSYYSYYSGAGESNPPKLRITYQK